MRCTDRGQRDNRGHIKGKNKYFTIVSIFFNETCSAMKKNR